MLSFYNTKFYNSTPSTGSPELKTLYEIMLKCDGVYGGRFSGAGFNKNKKESQCSPFIIQNSIIQHRLPFCRNELRILFHIADIPLNILL